MSREYKRSFATYEEAKEYADEKNIFKGGYPTCFGYTGIFEEIDEEIPVPENKAGYAILYTYYGNSLMYYTEKGTTFDKKQAQKYSLPVAKQKAFFMTKKGKYVWEVQSV